METKNILIVTVALTLNIIVGAAIYRSLTAKPIISGEYTTFPDAQISKQTTAVGQVPTTQKKTNSIYSAPVPQEPIVSPALNCGDEGCFNVKFPRCQPAEFTKSFTKGIQAGYTAIYYRIMGYSGGGCKIYVKYVRHPESRLVNVPMTCILDNKKYFSSAFNEQYIKIFQGTSTCRGELVTLIRSPQK